MKSSNFFKRAIHSTRLFLFLFVFICFLSSIIHPPPWPMASTAPARLLSTNLLPRATCFHASEQPIRPQASGLCSPRKRESSTATVVSRCSWMARAPGSGRFISSWSAAVLWPRVSTLDCHLLGNALVAGARTRQNVHHPNPRIRD
jgi:hypothetical protein